MRKVRRVLAVLLILALAATCFSACGKKSSGDDQVVYVYNWGEYIDPDALDMFEEETGIRVIYDEYETNEIMFPKVQAGAVAYDVICPSDYMIAKMIEEDLLQPINFDNIPNVENIGSIYKEMSEEFDPGNKFSVPYCWGTVGILYNKTMVDGEITSWSAIFDEKYADNILMIDSVRDAMGVALKYLGYSLNSTHEGELEEAKNLLIEQYPLVQAYVVDQVRDKMINNEAALGVIYSGEAIYTARENEDLVYVVPDEGSNVWIDSWVIPKNAPNVENAEKFIDFMCRPEIALLNFDYITYSTPNVAAQELIEDEDIRTSKTAFPDDEILHRCEAFVYLGEEMDEIYNAKWEEVKSGQ
ncbi:MAG: ABC transporter substrate-binding protein [Lachnospiraceae bacterium]|nr:ABC transporter substrate-binding protein [Lachnospiraceae bacterium]